MFRVALIRRCWNGACSKESDLDTDAGGRRSFDGSFDGTLVVGRRRLGARAERDGAAGEVVEEGTGSGVDGDEREGDT